MSTGYIPQDIIEEIKTRADIVSVVEQYVVLSKKSSKNYFGLCPFHQEDTASFSVSPGKQIYYCFGCHKGGDVINFIKEIENLSYPQAIQTLAERVDIRIEQRADPNADKRLQQRHRIEVLYVEAARFYYRNFMSTSAKHVRAYLNRRGISERTAKLFGLGYADSRWDGLYKHLRNEGYEPKELAESGLFRESSRGGQIDLFRDRLMFPILSESGQGRIIAFGGRVLDDSVPKYINSPETVIYTKGKHLYGLNLAKKSQEKYILLVEGYMDCITVYQGGVDCVTAVLGTALTEQQARLLQHQTEHIVLALDADRAGQQATIRAIDVLRQAGIKTSVLQIPEGKDPDQYIREHGSERFRALIDDALPAYDYLLQVARDRANEGNGLDLAVLQEELCLVLESIENNILFEVYIGKAAAMLGIPIDAVRNELNRRSRGSHNKSNGGLLGFSQRRAERGNRQPVNPASTQESEEEQLTKVYLSRDEAYLLILLASHPEVFRKMKRKPGPDDFLLYRQENQAKGIQWLKGIFNLIYEDKLTQTRLLGESIAYSIQGHPLAGVLAESIMKLPENQSLDQLIEEAERYELAVHKDNLLRQRTSLLTELGSPQLTEHEKQSKRTKYQGIELELKKLRS